MKPEPALIAGTKITITVQIPENDLYAIEVEDSIFALSKLIDLGWVKGEVKIG